MNFPTGNWRQDAAIVGLFGSVLGFLLGRLSLYLERRRK
jgi:hypothetical protein